MPLFMADARRRQRRWKKRIEAGKLAVGAQRNRRGPVGGASSLAGL